MINRRTIIVLLFWCFYSPASIVLWFLLDGCIKDLVNISFIGVWIIFSYLTICLLVDQIKKFRNSKTNKPIEEENNGYDEELVEIEEPVEDEEVEELVENDSLTGFRMLFSKDNLGVKP